MAVTLVENAAAQRLMFETVEGQGNSMMIGRSIMSLTKPLVQLTPDGTQWLDSKRGPASIKGEILTT